jgi:hypothetical protein
MRMLSPVMPPQVASLSPAAGDGAPVGTDQLRHEQEFAAALQQNAPTERIDAQPAPAGNEMMSTMVNRLDDIYRNLRVDPVTEAHEARLGPLVAGDPASVPSPEPPAPPDSHASLVEVAYGLLDNYRHMVAFQIQAEMVSSCSTASTKTFNGLLKGN